jgi:hypothetical protein
MFQPAIFFGAIRDIGEYRNRTELKIRSLADCRGSNQPKTGSDHYSLSTQEVIDPQNFLRDLSWAGNEDKVIHRG